MSFHVIIVGGGIGGLCLAQGLKKAGVSVSVYERDRTRTDRLQGYRIHIDPHGSTALHACLPAELFDAFVATCGRPGKGIRIMTSQLEELLFISGDATDDPIARHRSVSRITLRQVLLAGLENVVQFDKKFSHYEDAADGRVIAHFEDGTSAIGDVLVAADGVNSRVRQQFLPNAEPVDTGMTGIAAKVPLSPEFDRFQGANSIMGTHGDGMFIARQEFQNTKTELAGGIGANDGASAIHPGLLFDNAESYIFFAYMTRRENYPYAISNETPPEDLLRIVSEKASDWHPDIGKLVDKSDPSTVAVWNIRTSEPMNHWKTRNVTLIGDAIHSMTPARGIGGNVALRDAELLCIKLSAARDGKSPLLRAIEEYETQMMVYAFEAVEASRKALTQVAATSGAARAIAATAMRAINHLPASVKAKLLEV